MCPSQGIKTEGLQNSAGTHTHVGFPKRQSLLHRVWDGASHGGVQGTRALPGEAMKTPRAVRAPAVLLAHGGTPRVCGPEQADAHVSPTIRTGTGRTGVRTTKHLLNPAAGRLSPGSSSACGHQREAETSRCRGRTPGLQLVPPRSWSAQRAAEGGSSPRRAFFLFYFILFDFILFCFIILLFYFVLFCLFYLFIYC